MPDVIDSAPVSSADGRFWLTLQPHPLRSDLTHCEMEVGCSLEELGAGDSVVAFVDGERADDVTLRPQPGQRVLLRAVARGGGGGKDPLRLMASLAIAYYAPMAGGWLAGGAASTMAVAGWTAAVGVVGNLALNALIPPSSQSLDAMASLQPFQPLPQARNALTPFGTIPRVYGTHRMYPPMAGRPYSEQAGADMYARLLLCFGHGPLQIAGLTPGAHRSPGEGETSTVPDTVRIGDTPLNEFSDWQLEWLPGGESDPPLTLYDRAAVQSPVDVVFNADAQTVVRTSAAGARQISVDFDAPAIAQISSKGNVLAASVGFRIEIRAAGSGGAWLEVTPPDVATPGPVAGLISNGTAAGFSGRWPAVDGSSGNPVSTIFDAEGYISSSERAYYLIGSEIKPQAISVLITPPTAGQYDVRVTRLSACTYQGAVRLGTSYAPALVVPVSGTHYTDFRWQTVRSFGTDVAQTVPAGMAMMALRIRMTDQLNGTVDTLSAIVSALVPVWTGSAWQLQVSSNPAWIYRDILTGSANGRPVDASRIDDDTLREWAARNAAAGREFNGIFDGQTTVFEALKNVAVPGRGAFAMRDGRFSVIEDRPGLLPAQLFTDRNSWDFGASRTFTDPLHALRIKYKERGVPADPDNDADWLDSERIVYADGYSEKGTGCTFPGPGGSCAMATQFEQMTLFGITDPDQIQREGRYYLAVATLRPETATWTADIEHLVSTRGSVVRRSADAMLLGMGAARIKEIDAGAGTVTLDERFTTEPAKLYQLRIRKNDGTQALATITDGPGEHSVLTLAGGIPAGVEVGNLIAFGETDRVTQDWLITGIEPISDLQARITAVPYSPAIFDADSEPIPPYDPLVTRPQTTPPEPVITQVIVGEASGLRNNDNGRTFRILVSYTFPSSSVAVPQVEAALLRAGEQRWELRPLQPNGGLYIFTVTDGLADYRVRIRGVSDTGVAGPWAEAIASAEAPFDGELQGLALQEQPNTPSTPNGDLSTVIATVDPPADLTGYAYSIVEYRRADADDWLRAGTTDADAQVRVVLPADGSTYEFRARAVSAGGVHDIDGPRALITMSDAGAAANDPDAGSPTHPSLNVNNLRIAGQTPSVSEFTGADLSMQWDSIVSARDYRVRIFSTTGIPRLLRIVYVAAPAYTYTYAQNALDSARVGLSGPQREVLVEVIARNSKGYISATPAIKTVINPPPTLPGDFTATAFFSAVEMQYSTPNDPDYAGVAVYMSTTPGFTPGPANQVYYGGTEMPIVISNIDSGVTWYYRVQLRDAFGPGAPSIEMSIATQALPWEDDDPPTQVAGLVLRSEVQQTELMVTAALIAEWDPSTDNSGKLFYEVEYWILEDEVTSDTRSGNEEEFFALAMFDGSTTSAMGFADDGDGASIAGGLFRDATTDTSYTIFPAQVGRTYSFRVRAKDYSGNASDWTGPIQHTIAGDTVPPATPTDGTAVGGIDKVTLRWTNPPDDDWLQTRVHRGTTAGFAPEPSNLLNTVRADAYVDTGVAAGGQYYYKLVALDVSGNASAPTAAIGPAGPIKINPGNVTDFIEPDTIDPTRFTEAFRDRISSAESAIGSNTAEINAIQAELAELLNTPDFDAGNDYNVNDAVVFDGKLYRATAAQTAPSIAPPDPAYWQLIGDFSSLGEAVAANSAAIALLETDVSNLDGRVTTNASAITGLISRVGDVEGEQVAQATAIDNLSTEVSILGNDISAVASDVTALDTRLDSAEGAITANAGAISVLQTAVSTQGDQITAESERIDQLTADLTAPVFGLMGADGTPFTLLMMTDDGPAVALGARTGTAEAIDSLRVTVQQQGNDIISLSESVLLLDNRITTAEGDILATSSALSVTQSQVSVIDGQVSALSASVTALSTTVGENTTSIQQALESIDGIEGRWSVTVNVNGRVTGIGLIAGGGETTLGVLADRFVVVDPANDGTSGAPFEVSGGNVYIKSAFIRNLDAGVITSGSIATERLVTNVLTALRANVSTLSAIRANIGHVTAGTLTGVLFQTAEFGARVETSSINGLRTINASGVTTSQLRIDGSGQLGIGGNAISWDTAGVVTIPGTLLAGDIIGNTFRTGTSGWRVEIGPSLTGSTVLRYTNGTQTRLSLDQLGNLNLTGTITGSEIRTAASGARIELSTALGDLRVLSSSGTVTFRASTDGSGHIGYPAFGAMQWNGSAVTFSGQRFTTNITNIGARMQLDSSDRRWKFYDSDGSTIRLLAGDPSFGGIPSILYAAPTPNHQGVRIDGNSNTIAPGEFRQLGSFDALLVPAAARGIRITLSGIAASDAYHVAMVPNVNTTTVPNHTAPGGSFVVRNVGNEAKLYMQRNLPTGNRWTEIF